MKTNSGSIGAFLAASFLFAVFSSAVYPVTAHAAQAASTTKGDVSQIVIGVPHWEKFPFAAMMKNAFEMALEKVNKEGGVKGRKVILAYADDQGKSKAGADAIQDLVNKQGAVMLVGGYGSSNTGYMAGMAERLDRPFLVSTAADDRITKRGWKNIYRINPPASEYARGLEDFFMKVIKPKSLAILFENSPFGNGGAIRMMSFCREHEIEIRAIVPYNREKMDFAYLRSTIAPLKGEPPDVIYMVSYLEDAIALAREVRELGIRSLLVGGAGGFTHPDFISKSGDTANLVLTVTLWYQEAKFPGTKEFFDRYVHSYDSLPDYHAAEAYSTLLVAVDALRRADSLHPEDIREALDRTDMQTPFGFVRFSSYEDFKRQNSPPTMVLQVINGKYECVWPLDIATAEFVPPEGMMPRKK